jgi:hypothetical protein
MHAFFELPYDRNSRSKISRGWLYARAFIARNNALQFHIRFSVQAANT